MKTTIRVLYQAATARFVLVFFFLAALVPTVPAQSTVTINGTVKDQTGAAIPNATVTATNVQTGIHASVPTDGDGRYAILGLTAGFYDIEAAQQGFTTVVRHNQELLLGSTITLDFTVQVSTVNQTVEVTAVTPELEVTQSAVTDVFQTQQLDDLPVLDRNYQEMAALLPGVQDTPSFAATSIEISTAPYYATGYAMDGMPVTRPWDSGLYVNVAQDWVQEFGVMTTQFPAEFGGASSGVINTITRSGTNEIHGRVYGFFQDSAWNADTAFTSTKTPYNTERVGGMIGGPAIKNKLFYFMGYEYLRNPTNVVITPIPAAFAGSAFTLPRDATGGVYDNMNRNDEAMLKITYQINATDSLELLGNIEITGNPANVPTGAGGTFGGGTNARGGDYSEALIWKHTVSPTSLNEFRFNSAKVTDTSTCLYADSIASFNLSTPAISPYGVNISGNPTGYWAGLSYPGVPGGLSLGCPTTYGGDRFSGLNGAFYETFSKTKGSHEIKLGGSAVNEFYGQNDRRNGVDGTYTFSGSQTFPFNPAAPCTTTAACTFPLSYAVSWGPIPKSYFNFHGWAMGLFIEDSWRVTPNLTLNPGLRYDVDFSYGNFNKYGVPPGGNPVNTDYSPIAPRLGVAWTPLKDKSTVFRGGFGAFYGLTYLSERAVYGGKRTVSTVIDSFTANSVSQNPYCLASPGTCATTVPTNLQLALRELMAWSLVNYTVPNLALTSVTVGGNTYSLPGFSSNVTIPQSGVFNIDQNIKTPGALQGTIGMEHSFDNNLTVAADFLYIRGFNQIELRNVNINPNALPSVQLLNSAFTTLYSFGNGGWFTSKELLVKANYHDRRGDRLQVGYTFGYAYDNSSPTQSFSIHSAGFSTDPFNYSVDNGPSINDQRNNLVVSGVFKTLVGITIDPIITLDSALPYTATTTEQAGGSLASPTCEAWYNSCYPTLNGVIYTKNSLRGANTFQINARIHRTFKLGEKRSITPMFEAFNATNHLNLGTNFVTNVASTGVKGFMQPSGKAGATRQLQIGARFDF